MPGISTENSYKTARQNMLLGQLIPNRIHDLRVLNAMGSAARELFLPERLRSRAYADETICIDAHTLMFSPRIFASLLLAAELTPDDFVLNVKSGSGYSAAVMAGMAKAVVALESDSVLCEMAQQILISAEIDNVAILNQNPDEGFPSQAPFDVIFIEGIIPHIPENLLFQLAENGRLICITAQNPEDAGRVTKVVKRCGALTHSVLFDLDLSGLPRNRFYKRFVFETVS
ncbi:MAG: protein-L-isoaspartate O-methyltransferase [Alphaproteobacteria bacterium]|nr:protein-L-isoaspartate O-methyltransferase [Alphaproteobacteria bacterium]